MCLLWRYELTIVYFIRPLLITPVGQCHQSKDLEEIPGKDRSHHCHGQGWRGGCGSSEGRRGGFLRPHLNGFAHAKCIQFIILALVIIY